MLTFQLDRETKPRETFPTATLRIDIEHHSASIVVAHVSGEADDDQADDLARQLESAATDDPRFVILDLAGLSFISPAALVSLVGFRREQCRRGSEVWLAGLQPRVWLALHAAQLDRSFTIRNSVAAVFTC
jgi:anti-anti-sigma factor